MVFQSFNLFNNYDVLGNCVLGQTKVLHNSKSMNYNLPQINY